MQSDTLAVSLFNKLLGQYNSSITGIQLGSIDIAKELFFVIATISVAVLGLNRLLSKNVDAVETNIELIKLIIYFNVFYLFIDQFPQLLQAIVDSFKQAAFHMGNMIGQVGLMGSTAPVSSNFVQATNPGQILDQGISITSTMLTLALQKFSWSNFGISLLAIPIGLLILFFFGSIAIKVVIIEVSSKIILSAGIFMLAFSGSQWTRDYATRYIGAFFSIGIQMMFTYLLVGVGGGLVSTWVDQLSNIPKGQIIETYIAVLMASFVYYKICISLPEQAAGYLGGGLTINTDKGLSFGGAAALAGATVAGGMVGLVKGAAGVTAGTQGLTKAWSAIKEKGEGDSPIRTLHGAALKMVGEKWNSKVDKTLGSKLSQKGSQMLNEKHKKVEEQFKKGDGGVQFLQNGDGI